MNIRRKKNVPTILARKFKYDLVAILFWLQTEIFWFYFCYSKIVRLFWRENSNMTFSSHFIMVVKKYFLILVLLFLARNSKIFKKSRKHSFIFLRENCYFLIFFLLIFMSHTNWKKNSNFFGAKIQILCRLLYHFNFQFRCFF